MNTVHARTLGNIIVYKPVINNIQLNMIIGLQDIPCRTYNVGRVVCLYSALGTGNLCPFQGRRGRMTIMVLPHNPSGCGLIMNPSNGICDM